MTISLNNLVQKKPDKPPMIVIYGRGKMGKTTLAAGFPKPIFIQTEDGAGSLELTSFSEEPLTSFADVNQALIELATEEHDFQTLVIDSLTQMEPLVWKETCKRSSDDPNGRWSSIEDPGYGKGYVAADEVWRDFLSACAWLRDHKRMTIILIAHEMVERFSDPERDDYDRYKMRLHKRADAMIRERADIVGFLNAVITLDQEKTGFGKNTKKITKAKGSGQRALNLAPRPTFEAGNRYRMPDKILINETDGYTALAPYMPGHSKISNQAEETENG